MNKKLPLIIVGLAILGAAGWFFVSPLFIDRAVDEPFDPGASIPTRAEIDAMDESGRDAAMAKLMAEAESGPDREMDEPMGSGGVAERVASGMFTDADAVHKGAGNATLYSLPDGSHLVRFEEFRVTNGPALVVLLANADDPKNADDVLKGYHELGKLKGNVGNQNYSIPAGVNIDEYGSVVVWCELFDVLFSAASLERI